MGHKVFRSCTVLTEGAPSGGAHKSAAQAPLIFKIVSS